MYAQLQVEVSFEGIICVTLHSANFQLNHVYQLSSGGSRSSTRTLLSVRKVPGKVISLR